MRKKLIVSLSFLALIALVSCKSKADKSGLLIPKDAAVVVEVNLGSINSKISWDDIKSTNWYKNAAADKTPTDSIAQQLMNDPSTSGIDSKGHIVFFMKRQGRAGYFAMVGGLRDAAAFEKVISNGPEHMPVTKDGDLMVATPKEGKDVAIVWNQNFFVITGNESFSNMLPHSGDHNFTEGNNKFSTDSLKLLAKQTLALSGDDLLSNDSRFSNLLNESGDLHFWFNSEKMSGNSLAGMVSMMKFDVLLQDNITTGTLSFDDGKISIRSKQYFGEELTKLLKKYPPKSVGKEVLSHLPTDNVFAAGVFNYPPEGLKELLKLTGADGMANGFLGQMDYSLDEFVRANKGNIAFAITDFTMKRDSIISENLDGTSKYNYRSHPSFNYVAGVEVNDKDAFNKMLGIITKNAPEDFQSMGVKYKMQGDWFVASSTDEGIAAFVAANGKGAYADKISGHDGGGYIDINRILKTIADPSKMKEDEQKAYNASLATWQDAYLFGDFKDGTIESTAEINLVDKTTNSLKQLNRYLDQLSIMERHRDIDHDNNPTIDTARVEVMPVK